MPNNYKHCNYLEQFIRVPNLRKRLRLAAKALRNLGQEFDSIAYRGESGALIAPTLALRLNKNLVLVRKDDMTPKDKTHSNHLVEGYVTKRYVIVDDFIVTGNTARKVMERIEKFSPGAKCLGVLEVKDLTEKEAAKPTLRKVT